MNTAPLLIAVMGETASGKTDLAERLAAELSAQLVNADSFQVYRGMDIGTAKSESKDLYELIDIRNPDEQFGSGEWVVLASQVLEKVFVEGKSAVVVGGSSLNIRALFEGYSTMSPPPDAALRADLNARFKTEGLQSIVDELSRVDPEGAKSVDLKNPIRVIRAVEKALNPEAPIKFRLPPFSKVKFAIQSPVEVISRRIQERTVEMTRNGWLEEVAALQRAGYGPSTPGFKAHGYRELWRVLEGEIRLDEAVDSIVLQVRHYAKRQRTWLRAEPNLTVLHSDIGSEPFRQALDHLFAIGEGARENGQDH